MMSYESANEVWIGHLEKRLPTESKLSNGTRLWHFFDRPSGIAVVAVTLDSTPPWYTDDINNIYVDLSGIVDNMASFRFLTHCRKSTISRDDISIRQMKLIIARKTSSPQMLQINKVILYGVRRGVSVDVTRADG
jgi:hypothetical protein